MEDNFYCKRCEIFRMNVIPTFPSKSELKTHIREIHLDWRPFQCFYCEFTSSGEDQLECHLFEHPNEKSKVVYNPDKDMEDDLYHFKKYGVGAADCVFILSNYKPPKVSNHFLKTQITNSTLPTQNRNMSPEIRAIHQPQINNRLVTTNTTITSRGPTKKRKKTVNFSTADTHHQHQPEIYNDSLTANRTNTPSVPTNKRNTNSLIHQPETDNDFMAANNRITSTFPNAGKKEERHSSPKIISNHQSEANNHLVTANTNIAPRVLTKRRNTTPRIAPPTQRNNNNEAVYNPDKNQIDEMNLFRELGIISECKVIIPRYKPDGTDGNNRFETPDTMPTPPLMKHTRSEPKHRKHSRPRIHTCNLCGKTVAHSNTQHHILTTHLKKPLASCGVENCHFKTITSVPTMITHINFNHPGISSDNYVDHRLIDSNEYIDMKKKCFDVRQQKPPTPTLPKETTPTPTEQFEIVKQEHIC